MEASRLRRYPDRGTYDLESVKAVFDDCFITHVSYVVDGLPACMPMIALIMEEPDEDAPVDQEPEIDGYAEQQDARKQRSVAVYLHGHPSTKLMELVRKASREREENGDMQIGHANENSNDNPVNSHSDQVKVCITATKVDGLALSSAPNGHTFNYRSATIHGTCEPVRSKIAKRAIMRAVTNKIVANRWEEVNPVSSAVVSLVYVVKVNIDSMSVKTRKGPPGIQPRHKDVDGADSEIPPWTGVVPVWDQLGEPIESGLTPGAKVTSNLKEYIRSRNLKHQAHSESAATQ